MDAVGRLTVDARPEPPVAMGPPAKAVVGDERPAFSWSRPAGASGFRFQLARGERATRRSWTSSRPVVASLHAGGPGRRASMPGAWRRAPPTARKGPSVSGRPSRGGSGRPVHRLASGARRPAASGWVAGGLEASRYRVQLARDADFGDIVIDRIVVDTRAWAGAPVARHLPPANPHDRARRLRGRLRPRAVLRGAGATAAARSGSWTEFILPAVTA